MGSVQRNATQVRRKLYGWLDPVTMPDAGCPNTTPRFDKSYEHRYLSKTPDFRAQETKDPPHATWWLFVLLRFKCCFQFVWRNSTFYFCHFQKLPNLSGSISTWQIYRIKDTTFLDRRWIRPNRCTAVPRQGGHGGEVVGKPSLKSIGEVCPHHRKHQGAGSKFGSNIVFFQKVEIMTRFR